MTVDIVLRVRLGLRQVLNQMILTRPTPVIGPQVDIAVVDILVSTDALPTAVVALTAPGALAADGDQVVGIQLTDQGGSLCQPPFKGRQRLFRESTRLIADLPRHDGGIILIGDARITVRAGEDETHVVIEQLMRLLVRRILGHKAHVSGIAVLVGTRRLAGTRMLQVETIAPAPLPGVVQVEHRHHLTFAQLLHQEVETRQDGVVIHTGRHLQRRLHLRGHAPFAVRAHEDAQVVDADLLHQVEFLAEPLAVTALTLRAEDRPIPEIRTYVIIGLAVFFEMSVLHNHELRLPHRGDHHRSHQKRDK